MESVFNNYVGEYDNLRLYKEGDRFYQTDNWGRIFQLLPMAEDKFMIPSIYNAHIQMVNEGEKVTGLKNVSRDGDETFYPMTSEQVLANQ